MLRRWLVSGVMVGMLASGLLAKPGIVHTKDGASFQGDITEDAKYVKIVIGKIQTQVDKRNVAKIEYTASLEDQLAEREKKLAPNDVKGRIELGKWASENQRPDLAVLVLQDATKIDPANRDAALALDTAQSQVELDARQSSRKTVPNDDKAANAAGPGPAPATSQPSDLTAAGNTEKTDTGKDSKLEHRLLTNDEINTIRQKEMSPGDTKLRVLLEKDVVRRYLAAGDRDAVQFRQLSPQEQAVEILAQGDPKLANDVRIITDPQPIVEFKQKVYPVIAQGCASSGCHGGVHAGNFALYPGESPNALYTNFYILQKYAKSINKTEYVMLDRTLPDRSLYLAYAVPADIAEVSHPKVQNFRPRFRSRSEPAYKEVLDWLTNGLKPIPPDYGIKVAPALPSTQPSDAGELEK